MRLIKSARSPSRFEIDVIWNIASLGIFGIGGLLVTLVIVRLQNTEAVGVFNQVYAIYVILSQIGVGGLQFSVLKHISHIQDDPKTCSEITTAALFLVALIAAGISAGSYFLADYSGIWLDSTQVAVGVKLAAPGLLFFAMNKVLINAVNGMNKMRAFAGFRAMRSILLVVSVVVILLVKLPSAYLGFSLTATELILFPMLLVYVNKRLYSLSFSRNVWKWIKPHLSFGLRGMMSGILIELNTRVDVLMLGYFSTDRVVGVYSFVSILAESFSQIPLAIRTNVDPILGKNFSENNIEATNEFIVRLRKRFVPIITATGLMIVLLFPIFYVLWVKDNFIVMSWVVLAIIMVGVIFNAGYRPFGGLLLQGGRPGIFTLFITSLVISDALLNLVFIPLWGIYGAAVVTAFTYTLEAILLVIISRRLFGARL